MEHPDVTARSEAEVAAYRARREIHVEGTGVPKPVQSFDEASFPGKLTVTEVACPRQESCRHAQHGFWQLYPCGQGLLPGCHPCHLHAGRACCSICYVKPFLQVNCARWP